MRVAKLTAVLLGWYAVMAASIHAFRKRSRGTLHRPSPTAILILAILLVPLLVLAVRYGPVSCSSLKPQYACVCYGYKANATSKHADKQRYNAQADDLCPGYPVYHQGAGRP